MTLSCDLKNETDVARRRAFKGKHPPVENNNKQGCEGCEAEMKTTPMIKGGAWWQPKLDNIDYIYNHQRINLPRSHQNQKEKKQTI